MKKDEPLLSFFLIILFWSRLRKMSKLLYLFFIGQVRSVIKDICLLLIRNLLLKSPTVKSRDTSMRGVQWKMNGLRQMSKRSYSFFIWKLRTVIEDMDLLISRNGLLKNTNLQICSSKGTYDQSSKEQFH